MDNTKDKDTSTLRKRGFTSENAGTIRFTQKQFRVIKELANGSTYKDAAKTAGMGYGSVWRVANTVEGQREILRLREDAEKALMTDLSDMITQSLEILKTQLNSPLPDRRVRAAEFILKHLGKALIMRSTFNDSETQTENQPIDITPN